MINSTTFYGSYRNTKKRKIILKLKLSISRWKNCLLSIPVSMAFANFSRFKQRFKSLIEQYELRELHFHSVMRSKELELQYHMARFDREKKAAEAEGTRSKALNAQVLTFSKTESELRHQLNIYVEKFKQVRAKHLILILRSSSRIIYIAIYKVIRPNKPVGGGYTQQ